MAQFSTAGYGQPLDLSGVAGALQQMRQRQQQQQQQQEAERKKQAIGQILQKYTDQETGVPNADMAFNELFQVDPGFAMKAKNSYVQNRKARTETKKMMSGQPTDELLRAKKRHDVGTQLLLGMLDSPNADAKWQEFVLHDVGDKSENEKASFLKQAGSYDRGRVLKMIQARKHSKTLFDEALAGKNIDDPKVKLEYAKFEKGYQKDFSVDKKKRVFDTISRNYKTMDNVWNQEIQRQKKGKEATYGAVDQALITLFNKLLDPDSVVRESEYARTPQNLAYLDKLYGQVLRITEGGAGLTDEFRQELLDVSETLYKAAEQGYSNLVVQYSDNSTKWGLSPKTVVGKSVYDNYYRPYFQTEEEAERSGYIGKAYIGDRRVIIK